MEKQKKRSTKCFEIGKKELEKEKPDFKKAERFLKSSIKFFKTEEAENLLQLCIKKRKEIASVKENEDNIEKHLYLVQPKEERPLDLISKYSTVRKDSEYKSLKDFGYKYTTKGKLVSLQDETKGFKYVDQSHYDWLGVEVIKYIQNEMKEKYGLTETWLPSNLNKEENDKGFLERKQVNVFHSPNILKSERETLLLIIQGNGVVRAGQWAMKLCINNSLHDGTIFKYLERAKERNWDVLVANPNRNKTRGTEKQEEIPNNETKFAHVINLYDTIIKSINHKHIVIVAHSFGGPVTVEGLLDKREEILSKLVSIAFTDSVHTRNEVSCCSNKVQNFLRNNSRNWVTSIADLDTVIDRTGESVNGVPNVSAGTEEHIWTSTIACDSVFRFFDVSFFYNANKDDILKRAKEMKEQGNQYIKKKDFKNAGNKYKEALELLCILRNKDITSLFEEYETLEKACNSNLALVYLNSKLYKKAITLCSMIIAVDKQNVKSLRRRANAYFKTGEYEKCKEDCVSLVKINKNDKDAKRLFKIAKSKVSFFA